MPYDTDQLLRLKGHPARDLAARIEVRADADAPNGLGIVVGTASTYEDPTNYDAFGTVMQEGCYDEAIARHHAGERLVKMLWHHFKDQPMGSTRNIGSDHDGLHVEGAPLAADPANAVRMAYIREGIVDGLSVAWDPATVRYEVCEDVIDRWGYPVIRFTKLDLREWSPVTFAANQNAYIEAVRGVADLDAALRRDVSPHELQRMSLALLELWSARATKREPFDRIELHVLSQTADTLRTAVALAHDEPAAVAQPETIDDLLGRAERLLVDAEILTGGA